MEKLYTTEEIAYILNYDVQTIRRLIREGKIKAYKAGKEYRVEENDLKKYLGKEVEDLNESNQSNRYQKV
ncbi:MAG: helix-turn-helix domain-containing protein [Tetragenococcus halophilus]|nr:helix-turn-helix domain-containing protein [Tetragenococcus halophilus]